MVIGWWFGGRGGREGGRGMIGAWVGGEGGAREY